MYFKAENIPSKWKSKKALNGARPKEMTNYLSVHEEKFLVSNKCSSPLCLEEELTGAHHYLLY